MPSAFTIKWPRKERFFRRLVGTVPIVQEHMGRANQQSAAEFAALVLANVPVDTGLLRSSIRFFPGPRESSYTVQAGGNLTKTDDGYDYSLGVEYGNVRTPAQPYFWPAYRIQKKRRRLRVGRALGRAIREAGFPTR
jgi:hypothetical protein